MAVYSYKARASDGKLVSGRAQGDTVEQVAQRLIAGGNVPIDIQALGVTGSLNVEKLSRALGFGRVRISDLVMFSRLGPRFRGASPERLVAGTLALRILGPHRAGRRPRGPSRVDAPLSRRAAGDLAGHESVAAIGFAGCPAGGGSNPGIS